MSEITKIAAKGLNAKLPQMEAFPTQFKNYKITLNVPEYTSMCPKTGLPDFGALTIAYIPNRHCVELKSFKYYIQAYRNVGIFYENAVNKILQDFVASVHPKWASIRGDFTPRGGISTTVEAQFGKPPKDF